MKVAMVGPQFDRKEHRLFDPGCMQAPFRPGVVRGRRGELPR